MILDNAEESELWISSPPEAPRRPIDQLLISREAWIDLDHNKEYTTWNTISKSRNKPIDVPIFGPNESIKLLQNKVSEEDKVTDKDSKEIAETLGYLPLAITWAAAYLDQNDILSAEDLDLLKSSKADMMESSPAW